ncbi:MAG: hypothetical protein HY794_00990 [Desulfarculus sp.]|nr:hypothetical protein [Desulfarculus sp.]
MSDQMLDDLWQTLEMLLKALESPGGDQLQLNLALRDCMGRILEHPPAQVVERAERSNLPARPLISWLVHEAGRLEDGALASQARALHDYWTARRPEAGLIEPTPCRAVA